LFKFTGHIRSSFADSDCEDLASLLQLYIASRRGACHTCHRVSLVDWWSAGDVSGRDWLMGVALSRCVYVMTASRPDGCSDSTVLRRLMSLIRLYTDTITLRNFRSLCAYSFRRWRLWEFCHNGRYVSWYCYVRTSHVSSKLILSFTSSMS